MVITKEIRDNAKFGSAIQLWYDRCYGNGGNCPQWHLDYDCQMEFKRVAQRYFGLPSKLYYFDDIDCVDAKTSHDIPGVKCDDTLQWGEAIDKLKAYFKIA